LFSVADMMATYLDEKVVKWVWKNLAKNKKFLVKTKNNFIKST
jgi:hypothetical protein